MNTQIYKYDCSLEGAFEVTLPVGARFLSVQGQNDRPKMWFLLDPKHKRGQIVRKFYVALTGKPINEILDNETFRGTFQLLNGRFVGHLFELESPERPTSVR